MQATPAKFSVTKDSNKPESNFLLFRPPIVAEGNETHHLIFSKKFPEYNVRVSKTTSTWKCGMEKINKEGLDFRNSYKGRRRNSPRRGIDYEDEEEVDEFLAQRRRGGVSRRRQPWDDEEEDDERWSSRRRQGDWERMYRCCQERKEQEMRRTCTRESISFDSNKVDEKSNSLIDEQLAFVRAPVAFPDENRSLVMLKGAVYDRYLYVPSGSWSVKTYETDPGAGGYWYFDPPLLLELQNSLPEFKGVRCDTPSYLSSCGTPHSGVCQHLGHGSCFHDRCWLLVRASKLLACALARVTRVVFSYLMK